MASAGKMKCRENTADDQIYKQYPDYDRNDLDYIVNIYKGRIIIFGLFDKFYRYKNIRYRQVPIHRHPYK